MPLSWFQVDCHSSAAAGGGGGVACAGSGSCWLAPQSGCHSSPADRGDVLTGVWWQYWHEGGVRQLICPSAFSHLHAEWGHDCKAAELLVHCKAEKDKELMISASAHALAPQAMHQPHVRSTLWQTGSRYTLYKC